MSRSPLNFLQLLQLADSAIPIGATAHSFGIETLVAENLLTVDGLESFLHDYLAETGLVDAIFCRAAFRASSELLPALNRHLSALRPASESRKASLALGRRFGQLAAALCDWEAAPECHLVLAFGLVAARLEFDVDETVLACLQQSVMALVSACQRLLPLGQIRAAQLLWAVKPAIVAVMERSRALQPADATSFTPLLDLASMRHPSLDVRLFIS